MRFYARPWADGDPKSTDQTFSCECGGPACDADVVLPDRTVATLPAIAPGHAPVR